MILLTISIPLPYPINPSSQHFCSFLWPEQNYKPSTSYTYTSDSFMFHSLTLKKNNRSENVFNFTSVTGESRSSPNFRETTISFNIYINN